MVDSMPARCPGPLVAEQAQIVGPAPAAESYCESGR